MTLLVIVEQHMTRLANGEVWTYDMVNADFWERYLNVFEHIIVCGRIEQRDNNDTTGLAKSSRPHVDFVDMPDFRGVSGLLKNYFSIKKVLKKAIGMADRVIYRAPSPISMVAYPIVRKCKKPFALELMNNPITQYSRESLNSWIQPFIKLFVTRQTRSMCANANGVSYVTENVLQKLFPCRGTNNSGTNYFYSHYSTIQLKKEDYSYIDFPEYRPERVVIVHSGKMNDNRKGQDILIKVVRKLNDKNYNVELILIGDGVIRANLEQLARDLDVADSVSFIGWKTGYKEIQKVLKCSHIFAFPSLGEGLPRSVIEAMANSLITVASDVDGIKELLPNDLLIHANNEDSFASKIEDILDNWSKYNKLRKGLFDKSMEYENELLTQRRNEFYMNLKQVKL